MIKISLLLLAFTAQSVMAVSAHCSMDMSTMDMSSTDKLEDMHAAMGHNITAMSDASDRESNSMDCCDSINECPTGTCSAPAINDAFANVLSISSKSTISIEYIRQIQSSQSNLFRPPILA